MQPAVGDKTIPTVSTPPTITFVDYRGEEDIPLLMGLVDKDLSEPYSIFTYRYFLHNWPKLCVFAYIGDDPVGVVVCKIDEETDGSTRGYIGMLAVDTPRRRHGIGSKLLLTAIGRMKDVGCASVGLEMEVSNVGAARLYERLGFVREELMVRYYLNWGDAYRLRLWFDGMKAPTSKSVEM